MINRSVNSVPVHAVAWAQHTHRDGDRLHNAGEAIGQCRLQNLRLHEYGSSHHLSERFQAWLLHEDSSSIHVHRSGIIHLICRFDYGGRN